MSANVLNACRCIDMPTEVLEALERLLTQALAASPGADEREPNGITH